MILDSSTISLIFLLCAFVFLPFTLQTIGLFTPHWVSNSTCDAVGLIYSCCSGINNDTCENTNGGNELDVRALGLQATSFILMSLTVITILADLWYELIYNKQDKVKGEGRIFCCCLVVLTVAGALSFIACLLVEANYTSSQLGWSYYLCQVTSSYYMLMTLTACSSIFCRR